MSRSTMENPRSDTAPAHASPPRQRHGLAGRSDSAIVGPAELYWLELSALSRLVADDRLVQSTSSEDRRKRLARAEELRRKLDETSPRVRRMLQDAMAILPRELDLEASGRVARLRREYERRIADKQGDGLAVDLIADLQNAVEELLEMLAHRLATVVDELRDGLRECGVELAGSDGSCDRMPIEISAPDPDRKGMDLRDVLLGAPIAVVGVVTMNPILMASGASMALIRSAQVFDRSRKDRARKQLADISSDFQRQLSLVLHQASVEARSSLTSELDDALANRRSDLVEEIRSLEAFDRAESAEEQAAQRDVQGGGRRAEGASERLEQLLGSVTTALCVEPTVPAVL